MANVMRETMTAVVLSQHECDALRRVLAGLSAAEVLPESLVSLLTNLRTVEG